MRHTYWVDRLKDLVKKLLTRKCTGRPGDMQPEVLFLTPTIVDSKMNRKVWRTSGAEHVAHLLAVALAVRCRTLSQGFPTGSRQGMNMANSDLISVIMIT